MQLLNSGLEWQVERIVFTTVAGGRWQRCLCVAPNTILMGSPPHLTMPWNLCWYSYGNGCANDWPVGSQFGQLGGWAAVGMHALLNSCMLMSCRWLVYGLGGALPAWNCCCVCILDLQLELLFTAFRSTCRALGLTLPFATCHTHSVRNSRFVCVGSVAVSLYCRLFCILFAT